MRLCRQAECVFPSSTFGRPVSSLLLIERGRYVALTVSVWYESVASHSCLTCSELLWSTVDVKLTRPSVKQLNVGSCGRERGFRRLRMNC